MGYTENKVGGIIKTFKISRLILTNFVRAPNADDEADHINGERGLDTIFNLRWATAKQNQANKPGTAVRASLSSAAAAAALAAFEAASAD